MNYNMGCPVCRQPSVSRDVCHLASFNPLAYRIWSNIAVKCDKHEEGCSWTGSLSDYKSHKSSSCRPNKRRNYQSQRNQERLASLEYENERINEVNRNLRERLETIRIANAELQEKQLVLEEAKNNLNDNWKAMAGEFAALKATFNGVVEMPKHNGRGGYAYNRYNVVGLTKLICQNLVNKPPNVNSNKIFECVGNVFNDLRKSYADNPVDLHVDVRMLFGVCRASCGWFSANQMARLDEMSYSIGWG
mmetsp:Transcript_26596/g.58285  ORF Transcript_26596/g.58285 Transcript_26596/m.58285 type:complete len:248 (+) Transcript_26596:402-1145(+)